MPSPALTSAVESWFRRNQRPLPWRATYDPYLVWVSEVMLQQTRMEVVLRRFDAFVRRFPSVTALAAASDEDVLAAWSGLGYYRRARMLRDGARDVVDRFDGTLPSDVERLLSIAGIGRYTAGAISSIAFGQRAPIVDGNIARITARIFGIEEPTGSSALMRRAWTQAELLVVGSRNPRDFNQGLMEIGALLCTPRNPRCDTCPIQRQCNAFATGRTASLPIAKEKRLARKLVVPLYLISDGAGRILMRRESGTLMTSMLHLPHGSTDLLAGKPLAVATTDLIGAFRHTITTRNVEFRLHRAELTHTIADGHEYMWVNPADLSTVPHPSYVAKAVKLSSAIPSAAEREESPSDGWQCPLPLAGEGGAPAPGEGPHPAFGHLLPLRREKAPVVSSPLHRRTAPFPSSE